ncbi:MAG: TIGR01777 family oxidoreductase [Legionellales bacterium]
MNILIAGASGFIGSALVHALQNNHRVTVLGRDIKRLEHQFPQNVTLITWENLPQLDASNIDIIINLCGYNIAASRWSETVKKKIISSRVETNLTLTNWVIKQEAKPRFFSANAVGIYGLQENGDLNAFDEDSLIDLENPRDFLSEIGIRWQESLQSAFDYGMNVTSTRFGVVLKQGEGMLKKLELSFKLGLGTVIGDGAQILPWVHIDDVVNAILFLIEHPELTGAFNITSPYPVSQKEFSQDLAKTMHRPLLLKMPAFMIRLLFGEMGECLLLKGQRVQPKRLLEAGFQFRYPQLIEALNHEFS